MLSFVTTAEKRRDRSEKPGEAFVHSLVPYLQRIARTNAEIYLNDERTNILNYAGKLL